MMLVESAVSGDWDRSVDWSALADRSARAAIRHSRHPGLAEREIELSVAFSSDEAVRALNAQWRGRDRPTNVLSFPMVDPDRLEAMPAGLLGDVVLAAGICSAEAAQAGRPIADHVAHLVVHGTLHLLGYDHETSDAAADEMEGVERQALAAIGISDPYFTTEVRS